MAGFPQSNYFSRKNGHQLAFPKVLTMTGINNGRITRAYRNNPTNTMDAICSKDSIPEGIIAAKVPPKMTAAEMITVPIFSWIQA